MACGWRLRVGLSVGDVSWEDGDGYGLPVVEAARLGAAAAGGTIVCSHLVQLMARGRGGFEYRSMGELDLAGLAVPLLACEVLWSPPARIGLSGRLPSILGRSRVGPFVGRGTERASLDGAFEAAHAGRPVVVLVGGEPGIGKTRLTSEATVGWVENRHALALAGACAPEVTLPYQPVIEALTQLVEVVAPEQMRTWAGTDAATLALVLPALGGDSEAGVRLADRREEFFRAVEAVFVGVSAATTVVLVLEDLHWAPSSTLALVGHLVRSPAVTHLLVVITYRNTAPDLADAFRLFCGDLARSTSLVRLELNGLMAADVASLLHMGAGHEFSDTVVDRAVQIVADTDGNAFFITELVQAGSEAERFVSTGSHATTVNEVVLSRVRATRLDRDLSSRQRCRRRTRL